MKCQLSSVIASLIPLSARKSVLAVLAVSLVFRSGLAATNFETNNPLGAFKAILISRPEVDRMLFIKELLTADKAIPENGRKQQFSIRWKSDTLYYTQVVGGASEIDIESKAATYQGRFNDLYWSIYGNRLIQYPKEWNAGAAKNIFTSLDHVVRFTIDSALQLGLVGVDRNSIKWVGDNALEMTLMNGTKLSGTLDQESGLPLRLNISDANSGIKQSKIEYKYDRKIANGVFPSEITRFQIIKGGGYSPVFRINVIDLVIKDSDSDEAFNPMRFIDKAKIAGIITHSNGLEYSISPYTGQLDLVPTLQQLQDEMPRQPRYHLWGLGLIVFLSICIAIWMKIR